MPLHVTPIGRWRQGARRHHHPDRGKPELTAPRSIMSNTIGTKAIGELKQLLQIALYIYVCLLALLLYTASIAGPSSVEFAHLGYAAVKALLLAKFILLGHWLHLGERKRNRLMIYSVLYQALAIWGFLIFLSVAEEFVVGVVHGHSIAAGIAELQQKPFSRIVAQSVILFLVLLPYVALRQLSAIMGPGKLRQAFLAVHT
jgi:hypothetical protein